MNWIANFVRPRIKSLMAAPRRRDAGKSLEEMSRLRRDDFPPRSRSGAECLPAMRSSSAHRACASASPRFSTRASMRNCRCPKCRRSAALPRRERYADASRTRAHKTGRSEALSAARGTLDGMPVMVAVQPFDFLGGSLGMGVGEALVLRDAGRGGGEAARSFSSSPPAARACRKAFFR